MREIGRPSSVRDGKRSWGRPGSLAAISLAGVLVEIRVSKSERTEKLFAQGQLQDATGTIDVIWLATVYDKMDDQLKPGASIELFGTLMGEEKASPKLAVEYVMTL